MEKQCKDCGVVKDITEYPKDKRSPLGHSGRICSECLNGIRRSKNNPVIKVDKVCLGCNTSKPYTEFVRDRKSGDGLSANCKDCRNDKKRKSWAENKEHNKAVRKAYRAANKEKIIKWKKDSYIRNRDTILAQQKEYILKNKEARVKYSKEHYKNNKHIYVYNNRKREARLSEGINGYYLERMKIIYRFSVLMSEIYPEKYQVDHIIPLTNDKVSGLHVPWNLQLLTEDENRSKKNKFDGTYDNESWRSDL